MGRILPGRSADGARQDVWLHRKRLGGLDVGGLVHAGGMTTTARDQAGRLADLLRRERAEMAEFLLALAEFDKERGWTELGHTSLFHFLHRELGLSKGAAFYRKTAAELVQRFPETLEPLRDGRLCIPSVVHVARVLTAENRHEVLPKFFQRSRRDAKAVAAAIQPGAAPHRDVIAAVRQSAAHRVTNAASVQPGEPRLGSVQPGEPTAASVQPGEPATVPSPEADLPRSAAARPAGSVEPLTADLSRLHFTVSKAFVEKLKAAQAALSHTVPDANAEDILEAGLDLLLKRHATRKGLVDKPRPGQGGETARIAASVKRQVWRRDGGCCQWPLESGGVCQSRIRVEYDHIIPRAAGGSSTPGNIRLLCRFHNDLAARRTFGADWMNRFTRDPRASNSS